MRGNFWNWPAGDRHDHPSGNTLSLHSPSQLWERLCLRQEVNSVLNCTLHKSRDPDHAAQNENAWWEIQTNFMGNNCFLNLKRKKKKKKQWMFSLPFVTELGGIPHPPCATTPLHCLPLGLSSLKVKAAFFKVYFTSAVLAHASAHRE